MLKSAILFSFVLLSSGQDTQPPTISCPTNVTSENYIKIQFGIINVRTDVGSNAATVTWNDPIVTDDSNLVNVTSSPYESGDSIPISSSFYTITFTATDPSGNTDSCELLIQVIDQEDPICNVDPITAYADKEKDNITINFLVTVRDNVQVSSINTDYNDISIGGSGQMYVVDSSFKEINSTGTFPLGKTDVIFTVVDSASPTGNYGSCNFYVTINDFALSTLRINTRTTARFLEPTTAQVIEQTTTERDSGRTTQIAESTTTNHKQEGTAPSSGTQCLSSVCVLLAILMLLIL